MEFIVSNCFIKRGRKVTESLFAYGDFHRTGRYEYILEGYIVDRTVSSVTEMIARGLENCTPLGAYNVVLVDPENDTFEVKTDKRSYVPLYVFQSQGKVAVSNNPWLLADEFRDDITLDESSLRAQLVYATDPVPCRTLLKHITRIGVGAYLRYESKTGRLSSRQDYDFKYLPDDRISLEEQLAIADDDFTRFFSTVAAQNPDMVAGYGCSGGLDSRLIAHYTNKVGIKTKPFVVGEKRPNKLLESVTAKMSKRIAEHYGSTVDFIPYRRSWLADSMLLDIRNHPFFFSQAFINPAFDLPEYDYMFVGDPGGYAYLAAAVLSGNYGKLKQHADFFLGNRKDAFKGFADVYRKSAHHLHLSFDPYAESGFCSLSECTIDRVMDPKDLKIAREELFETIDGFNGTDNVEKWINIHDNITTKYQFSSAYDSMNQTKRCYTIYYPFFYEQLRTLPQQFLKDKFFLKKFLVYINPKFKNIPDQNLNLIFQKQNPLKKAFNRVELLLRGRGLQILHLLNTREYHDLCAASFSRENPVFNSMIDPEALRASGLLRTYAGVEYLKVKMIADIVYYKEFEMLIGLKQFEKVSW